MKKVNTSNKQTALQHKIAPKLTLPVRGAWKRLYGGDARTTMLEEAFTPATAGEQLVYGIFGPKDSGKTSAAFAVADRFGFDLVIPNSSFDDKSLVGVDKQTLILIDPLDAYSAEEINTLLNTYRGLCTILFVARDIESLQPFPVDIVVALKYPNQKGISGYIKKMLTNYEHGLSDEDFAEISYALLGLSYPQISSIVVDAALARLALEKPIDKSAFSEAVQTFKVIKDSYQE